MEKFRRGVKVTRGGQPLMVAVTRAMREFRTGPNTKDFTPEQIHFCPEENLDTAVDMVVLNGLEVLADDRLQPGDVRVTTRPMSELEEEKILFQAQVQAKVGQLVAA